MYHWYKCMQYLPKSPTTSFFRKSCIRVPFLLINPLYLFVSLLLNYILFRMPIVTPGSKEPGVILRCMFQRYPVFRKKTEGGCWCGHRGFRGCRKLHLGNSHKIKHHFCSDGQLRKLFFQDIIHPTNKYRGACEAGWEEVIELRPFNLMRVMPP